MRTGFYTLLILLGMFWSVLVRADNLPAVSANVTHDAPIGRSISYYSERGGRLTLGQAINAYDHGAFTVSRSPVLSFGIGARPEWLHFSISNDETVAVKRRLSIDISWLDWIDVFIRRDGKTTATYHMGDRLPFDQRPIESRFFAFDQLFGPGRTDIFVRIATPDPMVVPIFLTTPNQDEVQSEFQSYSYGFLYGFLFALLIYNAMLYAGLRQKRYLLYAVYLGMFLLMNIAYTGHGFRWIWPDSTVWTQWAQPTLMVLYAASGLLFGLSFLDTRVHFPRLHKAVLGLIVGVGFLLLLTILLGDQRDALLLAFSFVCLFTVIMLALGVASVRASVRGASYFLLAAFAAMVGAALTALAVWGVIPFNEWTFRAADIGLMLDATLLALALTYQFRIGQVEKIRAEELARVDPLTGVNNRRAFTDVCGPVWHFAQRHNGHLSLILLDLDHFKRINDRYGHPCGDEILRTTAKILVQSIRDHDVLARWGGEEFILLLPETCLAEAAVLAERLRIAMVNHVVSYQGHQLGVTASFGVAERTTKHHVLEDLITTADYYLYQSKGLGRNRVSHP
ncbi:diguanylate cyclase [Halothiobacillus sp.]|uniref:sensor domain-containing diguanylate cyclase n=1 Tax=Halothiobacillus sp. TaxID=1891311 RepID=UPI002AD2F58C|nr:diguanylate cyclase [Halothiobacillus sp.]